MQTTAAQGGTTILSYGTDWLYLLVPLALLGAATAYLAATGGRRPAGLLERVSRSLERVSGLPAWSASGLAIGLFALVVAGIGFYWDVGWHISLGRDKLLYTPAHMMILVGLLLIAASGIASIALATRARASVGFKAAGFVIPYGALCLVALGGGAVLGFPLDELWHNAYGIDVTMWGPTHLLMISGASFTPFALWLLLTEAGRLRNPPRLTKTMRLRLAGGLLLGLSTFQGEFDFGVPQFQQLYHPVLIALAASIGLVAARVALGRWGAIKAVAFFLGVRAVFALLVGQALNLAVPRFPLYIGAALAVEGAALIGSKLSPVRAALIAGGLVGTLGLAVEWAWTHVWGYHPWGTSLWPGVLAAVVISIPGAVVGSATGDVLAFRRPDTPATALVISGLVIVGLLAVPFPRRAADISGELTTRRVEPGLVAVEVTVDPSNAATNADWFEVMSWQGGDLRLARLRETGDGHYEASAPVPVGGNWKSMVRLARRDVFVALPIFMPQDRLIGAPEIPAVPHRQARFVRDTELLMREARSGPAWPALVAYTAILAVVIVWLAALAYSYSSVGRERMASPRSPARKPGFASG